MRGDLCPFDHGLDPVIVEDVSIPPPPYVPGTLPFKLKSFASKILIERMKFWHCIIHI